MDELIDNLFTTAIYKSYESSFNDKLKEIKYELPDLDFDLNTFSFNSNKSPIQFDNSNTKYDDSIIFKELEDIPLYTKNIYQNDTMQNIINLARSFVGSKYTYGGKNPESGFDCSGFISYVYKQNGIDIPATTAELFKIGKEISLKNSQIGDIICTPGSGASGRHVKMISRIDQDGQIYTIEAKGRKYGIVETPLTKTNNIISIRRITAPLVSQNNNINSNKQMASFKSHKEYAKTMYQYLYKALEDNGIDGSIWAPILTAHTSIESGWGNKFSRDNNNFGGIKGKGSGSVKTKEWSPTKGYYYITDSFKSYPSIQAFADDYVRMLKNKFKAFDGTPNDYLKNIRRHGYFTANLSDYQKLFNGRLNNINKLLNNYT